MADIQATLQTAIDLLKCKPMLHTQPEATAQPHLPSDCMHSIHCDLQSLNNISNTSQMSTILLFGISINYSPRAPINNLMKVHHGSNCTRSCCQSPPFNFLWIIETMPNTYLLCTPTDILHKQWHSNLMPNINATNIVWPYIWQTPKTHDPLIQKYCSQLLQFWYDYCGYYSPLLSRFQSVWLCTLVTGPAVNFY